MSLKASEQIATCKQNPINLFCKNKEVYSNKQTQQGCHHLLRKYLS